jgi:hypothetical protein
MLESMACWRSRRRCYICDTSSALSGIVGDVQGESGASLARTQDEGAPGACFEDEDAARGVTGRPKRGKRCLTRHQAPSGTALATRFTLFP